MNELEEYKKIVHYMLDLHGRGTTDSAEAPYRHPTWTYTDEQLFEIEKERIFFKEPLLVGFSCEMANPGDCFMFQDLENINVLMIRDSEGKAHALLNSSLEAGQVSAGDLNKCGENIQHLPCEEKYGMLYICLDKASAVNIDKHLADLTPWFKQWDLADTQLIGEHVWDLKSNWKLALDTFCEGYHFDILHKDSVGDFSLGNISQYKRFGSPQRHHRMTFPNKPMLDLRGTDDKDWGMEIQTHFQLVHFIYPNVSLLISPTAVEFFVLYPGKKVGEHITRYRSYWRGDINRASWSGGGAKENFDFIVYVVDKEDYWVSANVQKSLNANRRKFSTFGKNEPSLINMHRNFLSAVGLDPDIKEAPDWEDLTGDKSTGPVAA
ncbi:MAG: Rieske (2Fe-2S) protein [Porticoccaceae bacterium]|nr:Rieske (2Fe-2S) protein [Porticoccaceae bacterium]